MGSIGIAFARLAEVEKQAIAARAFSESMRPPTPHELRAQRKAERRKRQELKALTADLFEVSPDFALSPGRRETDSLEDEMRAALGLDSSTPPAPKAPVVLETFEFVPVQSKTPAPAGIEQASETQRRLDELAEQVSKSLGIPNRISPKAAKPKPKKHEPRTGVKRRWEVILIVRRHDGIEIPFFHNDACAASLDAEINAAKKARSFGLTVVKTSRTELKEIEFVVGAGRH